jgi:hypothetical protein
MKLDSYPFSYTPFDLSKISPIRYKTYAAPNVHVFFDLFSNKGESKSLSPLLN